MKLIVWVCDGCSKRLEYPPPQKMPDGWIAIMMKLQEAGQPKDHRTKALHFCESCKVIKGFSPVKKLGA